MRNHLRKESGNNLVEYALLVALVALASIPFLRSFSDTINTVWTAIGTRLAS